MSHHTTYDVSPVVTTGLNKEKRGCFCGNGTMQNCYCIMYGESCICHCGRHFTRCNCSPEAIPFACSPDHEQQCLCGTGWNYIRCVARRTFLENEGLDSTCAPVSINDQKCTCGSNKHYIRCRFDSLSH